MKFNLLEDQNMRKALLEAQKYSTTFQFLKTIELLIQNTSYLLFLIFTIWPSESHSQAIVHRQYLSKFTQDTIRYKVWVPRDWNRNDHYPSIYMNSYGALEENGMLAAAYINNFMNSFPKSVVIEIESGDLKNMNYSYQTGKIGDLGHKFVSSLKEELIPSIEKEFNTTRFRGFVGQSYSASYSNYLFLNEPGLFNSYILFTPERLANDQPSFNITEELKAYYKTHPTLYYIAPGGNDIERRKAYAKEIQQKLQALDSTNFHFKLEMFKQADHNSIVSYSLLPALTFIFSRYTFDVEDSGNLIQTIKQRQQEIKNLYGLNIPKNSNSQSRFLKLASDRKDKPAMDYVAHYFQDSSSTDNPLMLFNTAYVYYDSFEDFHHAEQYFKMSIGSAKMNNSPVYMLNSYAWMSKMYLESEKNFSKAWATLLEAYEYTHSSVYQYKLGAMAVQTGKNLEDGIKNLNAFINHPPNSYPEKEMFKDEGAYLLLSKCYFKKKDLAAAKKYLIKSLASNERYDAALQWRSESKL
jgi:hypothetical protein